MARKTTTTRARRKAAGPTDCERARAQLGITRLGPGIHGKDHGAEDCDLCAMLARPLHALATQCGFCPRPSSDGPHLSCVLAWIRETTTPTPEEQAAATEASYTRLAAAGLVSTKIPDRRPKHQKVAGRQMLFGHTATAVLRALAIEDFTVDQVLRILDAEKVALAPATISSQMRDAASGLRGKPAPLPKEQIDRLRAQYA